MIEEFEGKTPVVSEEAYVHSTAVLIGDVKVAKNANIWCSAVLRGDLNEIVIGENSNAQDNCTLHTLRNNKVIIGKNVTIAHNAVIHGAIVEDNCFIGMGAMILDGVVIGKNSIVGAGAVITPNKIIPENSVVVGNPFRIAKQTSQEQVEYNLHNAAEYVEISKKYKK